MAGLALKRRAASDHRLRGTTPSNGSTDTSLPPCRCSPGSPSRREPRASTRRGTHCGRGRRWSPPACAPRDPRRSLDRAPQSSATETRRRDVRIDVGGAVVQRRGARRDGSLQALQDLSNGSTGDGPVVRSEDREPEKRQNRTQDAVLSLQDHDLVCSRGRRQFRLLSDLKTVKSADGRVASAEENPTRSNQHTAPNAKPRERSSGASSRTVSAACRRSARGSTW